LLREKKFFELCNCIDVFLPWLSHGQYLLRASLLTPCPARTAGLVNGRGWLFSSGE
jgi:hypothetical protein